MAAGQDGFAGVSTVKAAFRWACTVIWKAHGLAVSALVILCVSRGNVLLQEPVFFAFTRLSKRTDFCLQTKTGLAPCRRGFRRERLLIVGCGDVGQLRVLAPAAHRPGNAGQHAGAGTHVERRSALPELARRQGIRAAARQPGRTRPHSSRLSRHCRRGYCTWPRHPVKARRRPGVGGVIRVHCCVHWRAVRCACAACRCRSSTPSTTGVYGDCGGELVRRDPCRQPLARRGRNGV